VGAKKYAEFSKLFQSNKLTFPQVITTKSKRNNDLINCHSLFPEILFTQPTAVLHKYLSDELRLP